MSKKTKSPSKRQKHNWQNKFNLQNALDIEIAPKASRPWVSEELLKSLGSAGRVEQNSTFNEVRREMRPSSSYLFILEKIKKFYQSKQDIETVEISQKVYGPNKALKFIVNQKDGKSLSLFNLVLNHDRITPIKLVTTENDYQYHNTRKLEQHLIKLLNERLEMLKKYYG